MEIISGGYKNVIVADNGAFADYKLIDALLKRATSIVPSTDVEEGSNNEIFSVVKEIAVEIATAEYDQTLFDYFSAADEARTPLYLRFFTLHPNYYFDVFAIRCTVKREFVEAGKFNSVNISGLKSGVVESNLFNLVYLFNPFNPENL